MSDTMNILQETFGASANYERLENGGYFVTTTTGDQFYYPEHIDANTTVISYLPGDGGSYGDAGAIVNQCRGSDAPNAVFAISRFSSDNNNVLEQATSGINNLGGKVDNVVCAGFSRSGGYVISQGNDYLKAHPEVNMSIISCDGTAGYSILDDNFFEQHADVIKERGVPIGVIEGAWDSSNIAQGKLLDNEMNSFLIYPPNGHREHTVTNREMITQGLLLFVAGLSDDSPDAHYKIYRGVDDKSEEVDLSLLRNLSAVGIEEYNQGIYKILKVDPIKLDKLNSYADNESIGGYLKTDFNFVESAMNNIRASVSKAKISSNTPSLGISGVPGLMSVISDCLNAYMEMTANLYAKIEDETAATMSAAQYIIDMDQYQKKLAEDLIEPSAKDDSIVNPVPLGSEPAGIIPTAVSPLTAVPNSNEDVIESLKEEADEENLLGKRVYESYDGSKLILNEKNGKISGLEFNCEFSSKEDLQRVVEERIGNEFIKDIKIENNKAIIVPKESFYENKTVEDIKLLFNVGGNS